jgi:hypothetical protein
VFNIRLWTAGFGKYFIFYSLGFGNDRILKLKEVNLLFFVFLRVLD